MKETNLIKTKFFIPPVPENIVERKDLFDLLDKGLKKKLTYLSASAGYGKSVLVSHWIKNKDKKVAWYSIDKSDNNFTVFIKYLINSLKNIDQNIADNITEILNQDENPDKNQFLSLLINEISQSKYDYIIILEDYHNITNTLIHDSVHFLLDHLPSNIHMYILSRNEIPELPLSKLRAKNMLVEIKAQHLKFNLQDIEKFFDQNKIKLSAELIQLISNKTEGWILGIYMIILSLEDKNPDNIFEYINNRYIKDFLLDEVFNKLNPELKDFMKKTAFLSKFNFELAEYLTGSKETKKLLNELEKNNLFIFPIDNKGQWFRYHNLFADFLYERFVDNSEESKRLILKTAKWFKNKSLILEAISYAFMANDILYASELIEEIVSELDAKGNINNLSQWFEFIPEEIIVSREKLYIYYCCYLSQNNQIDKLESILKRSERNPDNSINIKAQNANIKSIFSFRNNNIKEAKECYLDSIKLKSTDISITSTSYFSLGFIFYLENNFEESLKAFNQAVFYDKQINNYLPIMAAQIYIAKIYFNTGDLSESYNVLNNVIDYAKFHKLANHHTIALAKSELATVSYYLNETLKSRELLNDSINIMINTFNQSIFYSLIKSSIYTKNYDLANDLIDKFEKNVSKLPIKILILKIELLILSENIELVDSILSKVSIDFKKLEPAEILVIIGYYYLKSDHKNSLNLLEETIEKVILKFDLVKALLLKASILFKLGKIEQARKSIETLLNIENIGNYTRLIVDNSLAVSELIVELVNLKKVTNANNYFNNLVYELNKELLNKVLSQREIEILSMLNKNLTNNEMAEKLFISLNTLKTHLKNIYRKLQVKNRNQAIIKANRIDYKR